jgi:hypothetical protein
VNGHAGDDRPDPAAAAEPAESVPSPARSTLVDRHWSERDRRLPDDGALAPQHRYPGRIATP